MPLPRDVGAAALEIFEQHGSDHRFKFEPVSDGAELSDVCTMAVWILILSAGLSLTLSATLIINSKLLFLILFPMQIVNPEDQYFLVEDHSGSRIIHRVHSRFPLQFGRSVCLLNVCCDRARVCSYNGRIVRFH